MAYLTKAIGRLRYAFGLDTHFDATTLTGALTLTLFSGAFQILDPGGASRTITLATVTSADNGRVLAIYNAADADGELLTVGALAVLNRGEWVLLRVTAGAWAVVGAKIGTVGAAGVIADPGDAGAIPVTASGVCLLTTGASGETRTLAIPTFVGQRIVLAHDVDGGGAAVVTVASAFNEAGNTTITLDDPGETIDLIAIQVSGTRAWRAVGADGPTLGP